VSARLPANVRQLRARPGAPGPHPPKPAPAWEPPTCPSWLAAEAKREWRRILPELEAMGLLAKADRATIAGYCSAWSRLVEAEKLIAEHGVLVEGYRGSLVKNPACQLARDAAAQVAAAARELGLTPRARESLSTSPAELDEDEDLFD
jgi:P27 family predicted phage terminase small subunit